MQSLNLRGERGIRTPGTLLYNGFQDRRIRPLCHFSSAKIQFFLSKQEILQNYIFIYKQRIINNLQNHKQLFYTNKIKIQDKNKIKNITKRLKK